MSLSVSTVARASLLALALSMITVTKPLQTSVAFSIVGYLITTYLIPPISPSFIKIGLSGKDLSKKNKPVLPETIGAVSSITYLFLMFFYIPFIFYKYLVVTSGGGSRDELTYLDQYEDFEKTHDDLRLFPHNKLAEYLSAILCLQSTTLLGLFDDLFDIRWRHKFFLPAIAAIPLLIVYYVDFGVTSILIPSFISHHFPIFQTNLIDLGGFYYVYMASVAIFCPNAINILAGINGLEVGQSIIIGFILLINDMCYLFGTAPKNPAYDSHLLSAILLIPFLGVSIGLLQFNWFPARVFVGDTYCYFAGMVFAIVAILGHFSKTLLLFLIPQIFNFLYSVPQLFSIVPCPRHRMPKFNLEDGLMYPSVAELIPNDINGVKKHPSKLALFMLKALYKLNLIDLKFDSSGKISQCSNMTLINLTLVWLGPMREDRLCMTIMFFQFLIGVLAVVGRHTLGPWLFGYDNLWSVQ